MKPQEQPQAQVSDRRVHQRRGAKSKIVIRVEPCQLQGDVENVSRSGLLCFGSGDIRVSVVVEENGVSATRKGRLVRAQRMRGDNFGWAVEFD